MVVAGKVRASGIIESTSGGFRSPGRDNVDWYASFAAAVSSIGATPTVLQISTPQVVAANVTVPSTLVLEFSGTGTIEPDVTFVVTINSSGANWPLRQIFGGAGTIALGTGSVPEAYPQWWGASGSASAATNKAAINAALAAYSTVCILPSTYQIDGPLTGQEGQRLYGQNPYTCTLKRTYEAPSASNDAMLQFTTKNHWTVQNLGFDNSLNYPDDTTTRPSQGNYPGDDVTFARISGIKALAGCTDWTVEGCYFLGMSGSGVNGVGGTSSELHKRVNIINNTFYNGSYNTKVIIIAGYDATYRASDIVVTGNITKRSSVTKFLRPGISGQNSSTDGIHINNCENFTVANNVVVECAGIGIRIEQSFNGAVVGNSTKDTGQEGIIVYKSSKDVVVVGNTIKDWGKIPMLNNLRNYGGTYYIAREEPKSTGPVFPADPSLSSWFEANPYYLAGASENIPTYDTNNYYNGAVAYAGDVDAVPPTGFDSANTQGVLASRGTAGIAVNQQTERVVVAYNRLSGNLTQTSGKYNYASDYGISIVHPVNNPLAYPAPAIIYGNIISDVIKAEIYQPAYCDPINARGAIAGIQTFPSNYKINGVGRLEELPWPIKIDNNTKYISIGPVMDTPATTLDIYSGTARPLTLRYGADETSLNGIDFKSCRGTIAAPAAVQVGDELKLAGIYARASGANFNENCSIFFEVMNVGTTYVGGRLVTKMRKTIDGSFGEKFTVTRDGNVGFGGLSAWGNLAEGVIGISNGVAPTSSPANAIQIWSADRASIDGKASIHWRAEDGTVGVIGNLSGIGTATPTSPASVGKFLEISDSSHAGIVLRDTTADAWDIYTDGGYLVTKYANTGYGMIQDASGRVSLPGGPTIALPGAVLDVGAAGAVLGTIRLEGSTSGYVQLQPNAVAGSVTITFPATTGTVALTASPTFTTSATVPLVIGGTGTTSTLSLRSTSGVGTTGADIIFQVGNNGATEAARILNSGFFGVGTSSPDDTLQVSRTVAGEAVVLNLYNPSTNSAEAEAILFQGHTSKYKRAKIVCNRLGPGTEGTLSFYTLKGGDANPTNRVTIDSVGNVGVATPTPAISDGAGVHIAGKIIRLDTAKTPASAAATGNAGEICWDSGFVYVCVATNSWKRAAIAAW